MNITSHYIKEGRIVAIVIVFLIFLAGCSDNPENYNSGGITLTFRIDPEPLTEDVNSICLYLIDREAQSIYDTSFEYNPSVDIPPVLEIGSDIPSFFLVRAWCYDPDRRPLYNGLKTPGAEGDPDIVLTMKQLGFGSAFNVKVLRDAPPWDSYALDTTLTGIGLSAGGGTGQYYIFSSGNFALVQADPLNDLLIISNDQPQEFYDLLAININLIREFALHGGTVLWETCDLAWNYGSYATAGLDSFPGGISQYTMYDFINMKTSADYLLTDGLGDTLSGNYASNKYFSNVPDSALIYMEDSSGNPTLIGLKYGYGTMFYSGQPLEYNFDRRGDYNAGLLLPRIIGFILGRTWSYRAFENSSRPAASAD